MGTYELPETLFKDFERYLSGSGVVFDFDTHKEAIERELKAALAYQLFGDNAVLAIRAQSDPMILKVLEISATPKQLPHKTNNIHLLQ